MAQMPSTLTTPNTHQTLKQRAKNELSKHHRTRGNIQIRILDMQVDHRNEEKKIQKLSIGESTQKTTKIILLVGATGSGKTTLINAMVNYIYRVDYTDDFRLILIDDKNAPKRLKAESQTDWITAYVFYQLPGMPFDYNYILIDTPGFGDTRGIQRDQMMMKQVKDFLEQGYGIDQVDGVGFVTQASAARLTQTQRYVYDGLLSMFGKDIKNNIFIMATFADAKTPRVRTALKEARVHYTEFYKFNNSALFPSYEVSDSEDSDSEDEDSLDICKQYWDMGYKGLTKFFIKLASTSPASLTLTREVLEERERLQTAITGLESQIHVGLQKLTNLKKEKEMLARLDDDVKANADHFIEIDVPDTVLEPLESGVNVTNCSNCLMTCHHPCIIAFDILKILCSAMTGITSRSCRVCPNKCSWSHHKNMNFRYKNIFRKEKRTVQELVDRYVTAQRGKMDKETVIRAIENDIGLLAQDLIKKIDEAKSCVERLEEIALKPNPLSTMEYIDLMIESEKLQNKDGYQERIKMLMILKKKITVIQGVSDGNFTNECPEDLLISFRNLMSD